VKICTQELLLKYTWCKQFIPICEYGKRGDWFVVFVKNSVKIGEHPLREILVVIALDFNMHQNPLFIP
jgi:hypothetical protein